MRDNKVSIDIDKIESVLISNLPLAIRQDVLYICVNPNTNAS